MNRLFVGAMALALGTIPAAAQSLDDLNIQIHGYATQGFLYTTQNNIFTTNSSNGSPAWTEAVINVGAQPTPKLRIGVQARYFLLGNFGNAITLDWAAADYKASDKFGVRFGKVKTPSGLFNEIQDIDPGYIWSLLPQGIYPITSRNSILSHYGGVIYGTLDLQTAGKLEYRGWAGERVLARDDGYFLASEETGTDFPSGYKQIVDGAALHWRTPLHGLMLGASLQHDNQSDNPLTLTIPELGVMSATSRGNASDSPQWFGKFETSKFMLAGEYSRQPLYIVTAIPDVITEIGREDNRSWYGMASYKLTDKLTAGVYHTQFIDKAVNDTLTSGTNRYSKDWVLSGRYDFNEFLYAKAEQHFIDGTGLGYDIDLNPNGLQPDTKLTIFKIGVSF
jgi:hypothetical protein